MCAVKKPWNFAALSVNPNITWDVIKANPDKPWSYLHLSSNPNITWDIVKENYEEPWDFCELSANPNITWKIVRENSHEEWDYAMLSMNPSISWKTIQKNPHKFTCHISISSNPNITWDIVMKHPFRTWCFTEMKAITWEILEKYPEIEYERGLLCPLDYIQKHQYDWGIYTNASKNPNLTWEYVEANKNNRWNYSLLSGNTMPRLKETRQRIQTRTQTFKNELNECCAYV